MAGPHWQDSSSHSWQYGRAPLAGFKFPFGRFKFQRPERGPGALSVTDMIVGASLPFSLQNGPLAMTKVPSARTESSSKLHSRGTGVHMFIWQWPASGRGGTGRLKFQIYSKLQWHWSQESGSALAVQSRCQVPAARPGELPPYSESHMWPTAVSLASGPR